MDDNLLVHSSKLVAICSIPVISHDFPKLVTVELIFESIESRFNSRGPINVVSFAFRTLERSTLSFEDSFAMKWMCFVERVDFHVVVSLAYAPSTGLSV